LTWLFFQDIVPKVAKYPIFGAFSATSHKGVNFDTFYRKNNHLHPYYTPHYKRKVKREKRKNIFSRYTLPLA